MKQRCRCCLTTNSNIYFNIFDHHKSGTTYAENIRYLAEVEIEHDDGLPQQICSNCYNEVQRIYNFGMNVRLADEKLRQELEAAKNQIENEEQLENVQVLDNEYFAPVDDNDGMQVCVVEEILDQENEQENVLIVEEINEVEEIQMVEEILDPENPKENLLVSLAQVAATQENVNVSNRNEILNEYSYLPEDENDEDYLIEFDANESNNFKPSKWKCVECKMILRGDVSYEGHMNIHKQSRPHTCHQCQTKYRCRSALKRHKDLKHEPIMKNTDNVKILYLCMDCNKNFYSELIFYLHQIIVHDQGDKCPFQSCDHIKNLKEHIVNGHDKDIKLNRQTLSINESTENMLYQCFSCSSTFEEFSLLQAHIKQCFADVGDQGSQPENNIVESSNVIEIIEVDGVDISVQCSVCARKLLKKNLHKHMELHKRKKDDNKDAEESKKYLCAFCPREFKNSKSLHQHEKVHHGENSDIVYVCTECDRQYASQYLLDTHRKQAHKERDNICNICGNAFKLRSQLVNHMKLHLEKNIPCPHCDKKYARHFDLNVHLRSHTGEQPYACHLCDKRFAIKVRLTYHLQKHYGIKHTCKECGAEFNSKQKLKAHSFKHTGMPYRCELCDDHGFATRNTFKRHLTRVHHATISEEALNDMFQKNTGKSVSIKQIDDQCLVMTASEDDIQEEIEVLGK